MPAIAPPAIAPSYGTLHARERAVRGACVSSRRLIPLLEGQIRSCFAMTEPAVASSDATNIGISIVRDEVAGRYVINGSKWWITGAGSLHCKIMIVMGKTNLDAKLYRQQSQILVPMDTPGITLLRPMRVCHRERAHPRRHALRVTARHATGTAGVWR